MYRVMSKAVSGHKPHTKLKIKVRKIRANVDLPLVCLFVHKLQKDTCSWVSLLILHTFSFLTPLPRTEFFRMDYLKGVLRQLLF